MSVMIRDLLIIRETKDYHKDELIKTVKISNYGLPILRERGYSQFEKKIAKSIIVKNMEDRSEIINQLVQKFPSFKFTFMYEKMNTVMEMWNNRPSIIESKKRYNEVRSYHNKTITNIFFLSDDDMVNKMYDTVIKYLQTPSSFIDKNNYSYTFPINYININESTVDKIVMTYCDDPNELKSEDLPKQNIKTLDGINKENIPKPSEKEIKDILRKLYDLKRFELDIEKVEQESETNHTYVSLENVEQSLLICKFKKKYNEKYHELANEIEELRLKTSYVKNKQVTH